MGRGKPYNIAGRIGEPDTNENFAVTGQSRGYRVPNRKIMARAADRVRRFIERPP